MSEVKSDKLSPRTDSGTTTLGDSGDTFLVNTGAKLDINGTELILDADADTSITADTDDQIDIRIAGADDFQFTANTFTAQSGSTIAAQALTATTIGSSAGITITGTTPTLTIGDAGAEDTKIVFDGNAQDYHIGLDDTADSLVLGLGSALGTTTHMAFDAAGHVTKPLQSGFRAFASGGTNLLNSATTKMGFTGETYDTNADYDTTNSRFTAPVDGRYLFCVNLMGFNVTGSTVEGAILGHLYKNGSVVATFTRYTAPSGEGLNASFLSLGVGGAVIEKLDADDYIEVFVYNSSGATLATNTSSPYVHWHGELLG